MKITKRQLDFIINSDVEELVSMLQKKCQMPLTASFDHVYNSKTYQSLLNVRTGLFLQSPEYIYPYLKEELKQLDAIGL
ncbi:hypothetical protein [Prevotella denticola]